MPHFTTSHVEFEATWKDCVDSIGQACKRLRNIVIQDVDRLHPLELLGFCKTAVFRSLCVPFDYVQL